MTNHNFYPSDDLSFVAASILSGKVSIKKVVYHPMNPKKKIFYLFPREEAEKLYNAFISDKLIFSAQQLALKIGAIKNMLVEGGSGYDY